MVTRTNLLGLAAAVGIASAAAAQQDFRPFADVSKGYTKVASEPGSSTLFGLYLNGKDQQLLAEFPPGWERKKFFIAATQSGGTIFSGLQGPAVYCYWQRHGKRMALVAPELNTRSSGPRGSKDSVEKIFPDRVILDVPIVALGPRKQPVIDLDGMLIGEAGKFGLPSVNSRLAKIDKAKAFPKNIEVSIKAPGRGGAFAIMHYSISEVPERTGYKPRESDDRIGYFTTSYRDLGKYGTDTNWKEYINRWKLEKRDPSLSLSPPKEPIVFYLEYTVPVRYRRFVRDGVLQWNKAFEQIGIIDAIEVYQQDELTGAHMDKDPEDVRYNFVRWLNNDIATAIGPSRAHPLTGQILDADIVLTDGWIRAFYGQWRGRPEEVIESLRPQDLVWLEQFPEWDPRIQLLAPEEQVERLHERASRAAAGDPDPADSLKDPILAANPELAAAAEYAGAHCALCFAAHGKAADMAFAGLVFGTGDLVEAAVARGEDIIDNIPISFIGPQLAHLVAHEVGHTLGLRHNFKASSIYSIDEVNSEAFKGKVANAGSVMDYLPTNWNVDEDGFQGDYAMIGIGPYDMWAIEYGYTFGDPKKVAGKVGDPNLVYLTDEDAGGPDPLARRYDYGDWPLEFAEDTMVLVDQIRDRLLTDWVDDGEHWEKVRQGYSGTLRQQSRMIDMMANWVGGVHVTRTLKGDEGTPDPLVPVDPERQRAALQFVIDHAFDEAAYGLSPELLRKMTVRKWAGGGRGSSTWPIHDQVGGVQATAVTLIMNPSTLRDIHDNELRTPAGEDAVTLPEVFETMYDACYTELSSTRLSGTWTDRAPMISSLRRRLQADMTDRLIAIATGNAGINGVVRQQALHYLRRLDGQLDGMLGKVEAADVDGYTVAHLEDMAMRTSKALESIYIAR